MKPIKTILLPLALLLCVSLHSQMVTGVWHGKVNGQKVEAKIIKSGEWDPLESTCRHASLSIL